MSRSRSWATILLRSRTRKLIIHWNRRSPKYDVSSLNGAKAVVPALVRHGRAPYLSGTLVTPRLASYHPASFLGSFARKKNPPIPSTRSMSPAPWRGARAAPVATAAAPAIATRIAVRRVTSDDFLMLFSLFSGRCGQTDGTLGEAKRQGR